MSDYLTLGDLRRITGEPAHVLNHALNRFGPEPAGRIGIVRVWRQDQVPAIRASLEKTSARSRIPERRTTTTV